MQVANVRFQKPEKMGQKEELNINRVKFSEQKGGLYVLIYNRI